MKVLYFDCFSGISGDMAMGALLDLGVDKEEFLSELDKLRLAGYDIIIEKKVKNGITGTDVKVIIHKDYEDFKKIVKHHEQEAHSHDHQYHHRGHLQHVHRHHHHEARNLKNIEELIDASDLKSQVKEFSKKVFREIARAEAKVHNKSINEIHFHEVGAIDSIVDIVGVAICLDMLGVEKVFSSPLHEGKGFIECQHGMLPVPVPAVMEMLSNSNIPIITEDINTELVTPTGIGIIKCLAAEFGNMPAMIIDKIGYGMGKRETGRLNALRVVMGSLFEQSIYADEVAVLETNIDDVSSEILGYTMEKLLKLGALDVFYTPVYMKKCRPGVILTVLSKQSDEEALVDVILKETTSLGVRKTLTKRFCMDREVISVKTPYGNVRVKVASKGDFKKISPEYEDCRAVAQRTGTELDKIYRIAYDSAIKSMKDQ